MYIDTHDLCYVFILFTYDFLSGCTHCGKLRAELQNVISKQCGVVDHGVVRVALEHLHHVTDVAVVLSQLGLEPQGVQQIAFTDAGRDLVDLHM
jgi:glutamate racemase